MYYESAKCNKRIGSVYGVRNQIWIVFDCHFSVFLSQRLLHQFKWLTNVKTDNELTEENKVCSYIENIAHNKYDEEGEIRLYTFHYSDLVYAAKVFHSSMTVTQVKALCGVIALCFVLALYASYLAKKVKQARDNGEIEWKDSGIGFARSGTFDDYMVQH